MCMSTHVHAHSHAQLRAHTLPIGSASPNKKSPCEESVPAERSFPAQLREAGSEHPNLRAPTHSNSIRSIETHRDHVGKKYGRALPEHDNNPDVALCRTKSELPSWMNFPKQLITTKRRKIDSIMLGMGSWLYSLYRKKVQQL